MSLRFDELRVLDKVSNRQPLNPREEEIASGLAAEGLLAAGPEGWQMTCAGDDARARDAVQVEDRMACAEEEPFE